MRDIGKNIKQLREKENLTQEELAEKLFVTRQTVSNYETGKTRPDVDMILKIAEVLQTDANTVFYGLPIPPDRKKAWRKLIIAACFLCILTVAFLILWPIAERIRLLDFRAGLHGLLLSIVKPVIFLLFGWLLLHALAMALRFKPFCDPWVKYARRILLAVLIALLVFTLPYNVFFAIGDYLSATQTSVSLHFPDIPVISDLCMFVILFNAKAPFAYFLFGAGLWLFAKKPSSPD